MADFSEGKKIIRGGEASEASAWSPPDVSLARKRRAATVVKPVTAGELNSLHQSAHEEGFEQGRKEGQEVGRREGIEQGRQQVQQQTGRLDQLIHALDQPFKDLDDQVEQEIVTLVISLVRQLVRREIKLDPNSIVGVVREALLALPVSSRNIRVVLHPDDAVLVREVFDMGDTEQNWELMEDPLVQHGGCKVMTDTSQIDATLESRINNLVAPLLSSERLSKHDQETDG